MKYLFLALILLVPAYTQAVGFDTFSYCRTMTIDSSYIANGTTTDAFPALATSTISDLKATSSAGKVEVTTYDSTNNRDTPHDIIFTDSSDCATGGDLLDFEWEKYSTTTGEFAVWIETAVSSTTDKTITMYYGNASATNQATTTGVWDNFIGGSTSNGVDYAGVWHLREDPAVAGSGEILDSTLNANNGTDAGSMDANDQVAGQINGSLDFDGTDDYIDTGSVYSNRDTFTISGWIRHAGVSGSFDMIMSNGVDGSNGWAPYIDNTGGTGTQPEHRFLKGGVAAHDSNVLVTQNGWQHFAWTIDADDDATLYVNGVFQVEISSSGKAAAPTGTRYIAADQSPTNTPAQRFNGRIDELRFDDSVLSAGWIKTTYLNQVDSASFWTIGSEETSAVESAPGTGNNTIFF